MKYLKAVSKETGLELAESRRTKNVNGKISTIVMNEGDFKDYVYNNFVDECDFIVVRTREQ